MNSIKYEYEYEYEYVPLTKVFRWLTGSVNKTIVKPCVAAVANTYTSNFSDVKFRVAAQLVGSVGKAAKFRSVYDIGESNLVPASGL